MSFLLMKIYLFSDALSLGTLEMVIGEISGKTEE